MNLDKIIIIVGSILGIGFTYWFFLGKKDKVVSVSDSDSIDIIVDGGYSPEVISVSKNRTTKLNFTRKDPTACLEEVVLGDFKIRRQLPLNQKVVVEISPVKSGEFTYTCGMGMYHGKIIVK